MINDLMVSILGAPTASTAWLYPVLGTVLFIGLCFAFFKLLAALFRL